MNHLKDFSNQETRIKYSIDKIQSINKYFAGDEILSYICYINANPNMDLEEMKYCINYLNFLKQENAKKLKIALDNIDNEQSNQDGVEALGSEFTECDIK